MRHPLERGVFPQHAALLQKGRAVIQHKRRTGRQAGDQPVPHHPAARREIEEAVAALHVAVQPMFLQVLQQHAARRMDDALRRTGGSRRIQDVQRMRERQRNVVDRSGQERRQPDVPRDSVAHTCQVVGGSRRLLQVRDHDHLLDRRQTRGDGCHLVEDRDHLAVVVVAVDGDQDLGRDLAEAVQHALDAELRRTRRPRRAPRYGAEHRDDRFGQIRHVCRHAIARRDSRGRERCRDARRERMQLKVGNPALDHLLAPEDEGIGRIVGAPAFEQVLRKIETRIGEPRGARHPLFAGDRDIALRADDAGIVPDLAPEVRLVLDRPSPQRVVRRDVHAVARADPGGKSGHVGPGDALRRRLPEHGRGGRHGVRESCPHSLRQWLPAAASTGPCCA